MTHRIYLIQSDYIKTATHLLSLKDIAEPSDPIILMGDAVLHIHSPLLAMFENVYIIKTDQPLVAHLPCPKNVEIIDYDHFAELVIHTKQCIRMN